MRTLQLPERAPLPIGEVPVRDFFLNHRGQYETSESPATARTTRAALRRRTYWRKLTPRATVRPQCLDLLCHVRDRTSAIVLQSRQQKHQASACFALVIGLLLLSVSVTAQTVAPTPYIGMTEREIVTNYGSRELKEMNLRDLVAGMKVDIHGATRVVSVDDMTLSGYNGGFVLFLRQDSVVAFSWVSNAYDTYGAAKGVFETLCQNMTTKHGECASESIRIAGEERTWYQGATRTTFRLDRNDRTVSANVSGESPLEKHVKSTAKRTARSIKSVDETANWSSDAAPKKKHLKDALTMPGYYDKLVGSFGLRASGN